MDELSRRPLRCILHLDLDCFYAQVESKRLGLPEDEPLAVQQWGGLLAINYAARAFGIKRGMRVEEAKALCPALLTPHVPLVGGDGGNGGGGGGSADEPDRSQAKVSLERYRTESTKIFALLESLAPELERASIDEAYIDATELAAAEHAHVLSDPEVWARAVLSLNPGLGPGQSPGLSPASASALASASAPASASASASLARRCVLVSTRCVLSAGVGAGRGSWRGCVAARPP